MYEKAILYKSFNAKFFFVIETLTANRRNVDFVTKMNNISSFSMYFMLRNKSCQIPFICKSYDTTDMIMLDEASWSFMSLLGDKIIKISKKAPKLLLFVENLSVNMWSNKYNMYKF